MAAITGLLDLDVLAIEPWRDPVVEALGHDPRSLYVETFWLPILGPSTTLLLRRLATCLEASPSRCAINVLETSKALGLGERMGRNAPFMRTVARMIDFEMARPAGPGALGVRTRIPPLARRHLARLPVALREEHDLVERITPPSCNGPGPSCNGPGPSSDDPSSNNPGFADAPVNISAAPSIIEMRQRARQLGLSLAELGEDIDAIERQLIRWRFHPALARECATWALDQHSSRRVGVLPLA